ncbi:MAG TPA: archease [Candidatus Nanoarchaeia archaeon]|nr:archease [Candidatus Nanoarchaeia archaeon]
MKYKFLEHTADIKFRAYGEDLEDVFKNSALALKEIISTDKIASKKEDSFSISSDSLEELLYNFLEEFLILFDGKGIIISEIKKIKIRKKKKKYLLDFYFLFDNCEGGNYEISNHIKAITFNDFFIKKVNKKQGTWIAQVVVDV